VGPKTVLNRNLVSRRVKVSVDKNASTEVTLTSKILVITIAMPKFFLNKFSCFGRITGRTVITHERGQIDTITHPGFFVNIKIYTAVASTLPINVIQIIKGRTDALPFHNNQKAFLRLSGIKFNLFSIFDFIILIISNYAPGLAPLVRTVANESDPKKSYC
jgi:hypothetical protein